MQKYLTKKFFIWAGLLVVVAGSLFFAFKNGKGKQTAVVIKGDIVQEVASTGKVKPNQTVNLGFDKSGRVAQVNALVGSKVDRGQVIAMLESDEISADLAKARAALLEEQIKLREVQNTAPVSFGDASKNLAAAIKEGFASADDAVRNKTDQFFKSIPDNPQFEMSITSGNYTHYFNVPPDKKIELNSSRKKVEEILNNWQKRIANMNSTNLTIEADMALSDLNFISDFLDDMASAVNTFTSADYVYDTSVSGYKIAVAAARSSVSTAISSLVTAKDKLTAAPTVGPAGQFESVSTQEAKVSQSEAAVKALEATFSKLIIRAPFDGVVTVQDAKVGSTVSAGTPLVSIMSQDNMYIEANISEIHIGKIQIGNPVEVSFDAFPNEVFQGFVSYIEPGDVIVDGVVNYKVRVELGEVMIGENNQLIMKFANLDPRIKSGLTVNLKIQTAKKIGVLTVPLYAITKENGHNFVNKMVDQKAQKTEINLGISGNNGLVEVLNGLTEGEVVEIN